MDKPTNPVPLVLKGTGPMEHSRHGSIWGIVPAILGGMSRFFLKVETTSFPNKLMEAIITALLCGIAGAMGKKVVDIVWPHAKVLLTVIKSKLFKTK